MDHRKENNSDTEEGHIFEKCEEIKAGSPEYISLLAESFKAYMQFHNLLGEKQLEAYQIFERIMFQVQALGEVLILKYSKDELLQNTAYEG